MFKSSELFNNRNEFLPRFLAIADLCSKILQKTLKIFFFIYCLAES